MDSPGHEARYTASDSGTMLELSTLLNSTLDLDFILGNILLSAMGKFLLTRGIIFVRTSGWTYEVRTVKGLPSSLAGTAFQLTRQWNSLTALDRLAGPFDTSQEEWIAFCRERQIHAVVPMILNDEMIGVVGLGRKASGLPFTGEEILFLESTANIAASAVQNALTVEQLQRSNRLLDSRIQELNTLFEFSREMNASFDEQKILRLLTYSLMGQLRVMRYLIFLRAGDVMEPVLHKAPSLKRDKRLQRRLCDLALPLLIGAGKDGSAMERWLSAQGMHLAIPMRVQNETRGVLCLGEKFDGTRIGREEVEYLSVLANVCVSALENARLVKEMIEKQRLERELNIAREIQIGLLPKRIPRPHGFDIAAVNISSQQIGGDYYDVIQLNQDEFAVAIADVSGKGIPASLLMANVQATLRVLVPLNLPLSEATARINRVITENTSPDKFITFFWGILNVPERTFRYVNAGHNPPFLVHTDGTHETLDKGGMILGVFAYAPPYEEGSVTLTDGDCLILYTDGIPEAMNAEQKEYGDLKFLEVLRKNVLKPATDIISSTHKSIQQFTAGAPQSDDITMLVVRVGEGGSMKDEV